jgi:hypothetical protein
MASDCLWGMPHADSISMVIASIRAIIWCNRKPETRKGPILCFCNNPPSWELTQSRRPSLIPCKGSISNSLITCKGPTTFHSHTWAFGNMLMPWYLAAYQNCTASLLTNRLLILNQIQGTGSRGMLDTSVFNKHPGWLWQWTGEVLILSESRSPRQQEARKTGLLVGKRTY